MPVPTTFDRVAVIGNGIIGHGVAQVYAVAGKDVGADRAQRGEPRTGDRQRRARASPTSRATAS